MTDIEIARRAKKEPITNILSSLGVSEENYILYGKEMKVMNISRVPKNCMRDIYMLLSEYLIEDYAHNENIHE